MPRNLFVALVAVVVLATGVVIRTGYDDSGADNNTNEVANTAAVVNFSPRDGEMIVSGSLDCLPLSSGVPLAEGECVMGLRGDDGRFYSLDTLNMEDAWAGGASGRVNVIGSFESADSGNEEAGGYAYNGVIRVRAIQSN